MIFTLRIHHHRDLSSAIIFQVHRRECRLLQDENNLAQALAATDPRFVEASDARTLRTIFSKSQEMTPLIFVLTELKSFLKSSMLYWDPEVCKFKKIGFHTGYLIK